MTTSDRDAEHFRRLVLACLASVCDAYGVAEREAIQAEEPLSDAEWLEHLRRIGLDVPDDLQEPRRRTERGNPALDGRDARAAS